MSEALNTPGYGIDQFQSDVVATRRGGHPEDWENGYYTLINDEWAEFVSQHGNVMGLLLPHVDRQKELAADPELLAGVKEEIGDLLWFDVSAAALLGKDTKTLCAEALKSHTGKTIVIESLDDLQAAVRANAHKIEVMTKRGMYRPGSPREQRFVSLFGSPYYLFNRTTFRLTRALTGGQHDVAPYTASMMEPVSNLEQAIGDHINTLAYIAHLMGLGLEEVARSNIEKNHQRLTESYSKST